MFQISDGEAASRVADWVELELAAGEAQLSKSKVAAIVESVVGSEPAESFLSDVWRDLEDRESRYTRQFFHCEGDLASRSLEGPAPPEYMVCLLFSLYGVSEEHRSDPKIFERLSAVAIRNYLQGKMLVFGWPVLPNVQADIALRVKDVASQTREKFVVAPASRYKDRGVDVIAWRPFEEHTAGQHRTNQLVILAQCAAGSNWKGKTGQLPHKAWTEYIHWACEPVLGFAVPVVISEDHWHDISKECGGILFDRVRLVNLLPDGVQDEDLSGQMAQWVSLELEDNKS